MPFQAFLLHIFSVTEKKNPTRCRGKIDSVELPRNAPSLNVILSSASSASSKHLTTIMTFQALRILLFALWLFHTLNAIRSQFKPDFITISVILRRNNLSAETKETKIQKRKLF